MRHRTLGQGLTVPELGLGCMGMSQSYGTPDDEESVATIHRALDLGMTMLDTSDSYGPYTNERLVSAGKVRFLGISEAAPATVRRAHAVHPMAVGQYEYSLFSRDPEAEVLPLLRELGIGMVCYSPLGRGMLTGTLPAAGEFGERDFRRTAPRFQGGNLQHNLAVANRIAALATAKGVTPAQLALAWVLAQGDDLVAIPGTKRRTYLEQNLAATEITLSPGELGQLGELAPAGVAAGDRYPPAMMARLGQ